MLKFYFNGIKENGGKLQRCFYSEGKLISGPEGTITIYGRDYSPFSAEVHAKLRVTNDTDLQTDYIVQDIIRVAPTHPMYCEVRAAFLLAKAHNAKVGGKRQARYTQAQRVQQAA